MVIFYFFYFITFSRLLTKPFFLSFLCVFMLPNFYLQPANPLQWHSSLMNCPSTAIALTQSFINALSTAPAMTPKFYLHSSSCSCNNANVNAPKSGEILLHFSFKSWKLWFSLRYLFVVHWVRTQKSSYFR